MPVAAMVRLVVSLGMMLLLMYFLVPHALEKKWMLLALGGTFVVLSALNLLLQYFVGTEAYTFFFLPAVVLPVWLFCRLTGTLRGPKLLTAIALGSVMMMLPFLVGSLVSSLAPDPATGLWADLAARVLVYAGLLAFVLLYFRKSFHRLLYSGMRGWWLVAVVVILILLSLYFTAIYPRPLTQRPSAIPSTILLFMLAGFAYSIIHISVDSVTRYQQSNGVEIFLRYQSGLLQEQTEHRQADINRMRTFRHDVRHDLQTVAALLRDGKSKEALGYIERREEIFREEAGEVRTTAAMGDVAYIRAIMDSFRQRVARAEVRLTENLPVEDPVFTERPELFVLVLLALEFGLQVCSRKRQWAEKGITVFCENRGGKLLTDVSFPGWRRDVDAAQVQTIRDMAAELHGVAQTVAQDGEVHIRLLFFSGARGGV